MPINIITMVMHEDVRRNSLCVCLFFFVDSDQFVLLVGGKGAQQAWRQLSPVYRFKILVKIMYDNNGHQDIKVCMHACH